MSESPYKKGWSRVGAWMGTLKNPAKCLWRWEPDRRSNYFFSPPAHLCAVTCMTEILLIVTLNNQFTSPHFRQLRKMKRKKSCLLRMWCMEGRKGQFQFHTLNSTFVDRRHLPWNSFEMTELVKLQGKVLEVIFDELWPWWSCVLF